MGCDSKVALSLFFFLYSRNRRRKSMLFMRAEGEVSQSLSSLNTYLFNYNIRRGASLIARKRSEGDRRKGAGGESEHEKLTA